MSIIGCDLHTRYQVVAWIDEGTGEIQVRRLEHEGEEVRKFYAQFARGTVVGLEATFPALWFERLLAELGHELWVGDAARIRASEVRQQKTDPRDAELLLDLLRTGRFPRIWVPSVEERDLRQLLVHRMKLVRARTAVKNQLHALAISQGVCRKRKLWSAQGRAELEKLALYRLDGQIGPEDVKALVAEAVPGSNWAFLDAVGMRRAAEAAELADHLEDVPAQLFLVRLYGRIKQLIDVADLLASGTSEPDIMRMLKVKSAYRAQLLAQQARTWTLSELDDALAGLLDLDASLKGHAGGSDTRRRATVSLWIAEKVRRPDKR